MFQIKVVEKIKTHILCSATFSNYRAVFDIMSKNMVEPERPQTISRMHVTCWISKATRAQTRPRPCTHTRAGATHTHTHTHTHAHRNTYVKCFAFPLQQCSREGA